jgi:hypothetical protein
VPTRKRPLGRRASERVRQLLLDGVSHASLNHACAGHAWAREVSTISQKKRPPKRSRRDENAARDDPSGDLVWGRPRRPAVRPCKPLTAVGS